MNNAHDFTLGIPLVDTTDDDMERSWRSAALGTLYFMQACFAPIRDHGGGKILNIGSGSALDGDAGAASYVAAKEAVRALPALPLVNGDRTASTSTRCAHSPARPDGRPSPRSTRGASSGKPRRSRSVARPATPSSTSAAPRCSSSATTRAT